MSNKIRGRALIININKFNKTGKVRTGSTVDYDNISSLFKDLRFDIVKSQKELTDLTQQVLVYYYICLPTCKLCEQVKWDVRSYETSNLIIYNVEVLILV